MSLVERRADLRKSKLSAGKSINLALSERGWNAFRQVGIDQELRKPDGDGVQYLSLDNYYVMRDYVADPQFLLQKKFERRIEQLYTNLYTPFYSQVSFTNIRYSEAYQNGKKQDLQIRQLMEEHNIDSLFESGNIDDLIHAQFGQAVLAGDTGHKI